MAEKMLARVSILTVALSHCAISPPARELEVADVVATESGEVTVLLFAFVHRDHGVEDLGLRLITINDDDVECEVVPTTSSANFFHVTRYLHDASPPALVVDEAPSLTSLYERGAEGWERVWSLSAQPSGAWTGADGRIRIFSDRGLHTVPEDRRATIPPPVPLAGECGGLPFATNTCRLVPTADDVAVGIRLDWADVSMIRATCDGASCSVDGSGPAVGTTHSIGSLLVTSEGEPLYVFDEQFEPRMQVVSFDGDRAPIDFDTNPYTYAAAPRPAGGFAAVGYAWEPLVAFVRDPDGTTRRFDLADIGYGAAGFSVGMVVTGSGAEERVRIYLDRGASRLREITLTPASGEIDSRTLPVCH